MTAAQAKTGVEVERLPELPKLPPLPESDYTLTEQSGVLDKVTAREFAVFTEYSMREYARTAIAAKEAEVGRLMEILRSWKAAEEYTAQYRHLSEAVNEISGAWESANQARDAVLKSNQGETK